MDPQKLSLVAAEAAPIADRPKKVASNRETTDSTPDGACALSHLGVECDEEFVSHVVEAIGDERLVTTSDYPHGDAKYPESMDRFFTLPISDESKKKILWDNPARLYGF